MIKKIFYWCGIGFLLLFAISFFAKDGFNSLITGVATGFSVAIGNIIANDYLKKQSNKLIKRMKHKTKKKVS